MVYGMAWRTSQGIWYGLAASDSHGMVYAMAWRASHDIWPGLADIAWYMVWPGVVCHGMWKGIVLHA